jgi:hypothetical protein
LKTYAAKQDVKYANQLAANLNCLFETNKYPREEEQALANAKKAQDSTRFQSARNSVDT